MKDNTQETRYNEHKYHFAALLNTAQHNFFLALQEVNSRLEKTVNSSSSKNIKRQIKIFIENIFKDSFSYTDWERNVQYASEFLTFLSVLDNVYVHQYKNDNDNKEPSVEEKRKYLRETLFLINETLDNLRNEQTHFHHSSRPIPDEIKKLLDSLLLKAVKETRKKVKNPDYLDFLKKKYPEEFSAPQNRKTKNGQKGKEKENYLMNNVFYSIIGKVKGEEKENLKNSTIETQEDGKTVFTNNGFVLFLSLFLTRRQLEDVMDHVQYFKGTHELKFIVNRQLFTCFCFRDVRKSLRSEYSDYSLLMQMTEELNRCPAPLYEVLEPQNKKQFIEDINEYMKDNSEFTGSSEQARVIHPVIRKRYEEKFAYFALRFLDEFCNFPTLRFQVVVGEYVKDRKNKNLSYGFMSDRIIKKKVYYMGRLSEVAKFKKDYFTERKQQTEGWREYPNPYYNFIDKKIPVYIAFNDELYLHDLFSYSVKKPNFFLSLHELPALLHQVLVYRMPPEKIEEKIRKKIQEKVQSVISGEGKLPKKLKQISGNLENKWNSQLLEKHINEEITKNDEKLEQICRELKDSKYDTFNNKQKGEYATWLAYDIKRLCGKKNIKDWKGHVFSEMQTLLSQYYREKEKLFSLWENELNVSTHPFISECKQSNSLEEFIKEYLEKRSKFLKERRKKILTNGVKGEDNPIFQYFEKRYYRNYTSKEDYLKVLFSHPVNIDRGIFDGRPTAGRKEELEAKAVWFTYAEEQVKQKFYDFPRLYQYKEEYSTTDFYLKTQNKFIDQIPDKWIEKYKADEGKQGKDKKHPEINNFIKQAYKNEKEIRRIKRNDVYLYEMLKQVFLKIMNMGVSVKKTKEPAHEVKLEVKLKDLWLTREERAEAVRKSLPQSERVKGDNSENIQNEDYFLSFPVPVHLYGGDLREEVKIKDIGKFRRMEKDERVQQLMQYYKGKTWQPETGSLEYINRDLIQKELDSYHNIRLNNIFKEVHALEQIIYKKAKQKEEESQLLKEENPNFKHYISYYFIENEDKREKFNKISFDNKLSISTIEEFKEAALLVIIRNKFAHNQFPDKEMFKAMIDYSGLESLKNETVAEYLLELFKTINKKLLEKVNKKQTGNLELENKH